MPYETDSDNKTLHQKILVTGASGLVGKELLKQLLEKGYRVTAIYNSTALNMAHPNLETIQCDILDVVALEEAMKEITHVYHCAGIVSFDPKENHHLLKINVEGTANLVNICIDEGVQKLVHVSSVAALGRVKDGELVTEKINWEDGINKSVYGKSKHFGEIEVWRGIGEGLQAVIVNPTIIFGGDNWESGSAAIFKTAYNEFKWYTDGVTGFVDVSDVARAMILLMNSEITAQRFILNGENLSYKEIFSSIATQFGKRPPYKRVTPFMASMVWRTKALSSMLTGKKQLLTKETSRKAQLKVYFDNNKILSALPEFQFTKIKDTIARTCATLRDKYHL